MRDVKLAESCLSGNPIRISGSSGAKIKNAPVVRDSRRLLLVGILPLRGRAFEYCDGQVFGRPRQTNDTKTSVWYVSRSWRGRYLPSDRTFADTLVYDIFLVFVGSNIYIYIYIYICIIE